MRVLVAIISLIGGIGLSAGEIEPTRYYVQLVRGARSSESIPAGMRPVGLKLKEKLGAPFKSGGYWETKREEVLVTPGKPSKVALNPERSVQIEITGNRRVVTSYYKGRPIERRSAPRGDGITLVGDNYDGRISFVVVRRDKP